MPEIGESIPGAGNRVSLSTPLIGISVAPRVGPTDATSVGCTDDGTVGRTDCVDPGDGIYIYPAEYLPDATAEVRIEVGTPPPSAPSTGAVDGSTYSLKDTKNASCGELAQLMKEKAPVAVSTGDETPTDGLDHMPPFVASRYSATLNGPPATGRSVT